MNIIVKVIMIMLLVLSCVENVWCIEVESIKEVASYVLTPDMGADYSNPRFSPDGTKIAASSDKGLIIMNTDSNNISILKDKGRFRIPKWSPDSSKIAFESRSSTGKGTSIWIVNRNGSNVYELTKGTDDDGPVWSPDGTKIAFYKVIKGKSSIWTINIDRSNLRQISPEGEDFSHPLFTPDGTKIVCVKNYYNRVFDMETWIMNSDGIDLNIVSKDGGISTNGQGGAIWSSDGKKIWQTAYVFDITTGKWDETIEGGVLSPDWKWICYEDVKLGFEDTAIDSQLSIISFYGANNLQITNEPDMIYEAQDWSKDGKMIIATKENNPEKVEYTRPRIVVIKLRY